MYLSNFQKEIVKRISNDKIKTILDFLVEFNLVIPNVSEKKAYTVGGKNISEGESDFFIDKVHYKVVDREDAFNKLIDFKKVINLLSKAELIEIENSAGLEFGYVATEDRPIYIISIINSFYNSRIISYNEIKNFAKDFRTPQERSQFWRGWLPIIVAVITVALSSITNYFIYTNDRDVYIKNSNAFKDSLYINILNDIDSPLTNKKIELDSLKSSDDNKPSSKELNAEE
jgi:hypothetical protein